MRIGILLGPLETLSNYELGIVDQVFRDPTLELALVVQDGRAGETNLGSTRSVSTGWSRRVGVFLFRLQLRVERQLYRDRFTVDRDAILARLRSTKTVSLKPERNGRFDVFSDADAEEISRHDLEVLFQLAFNDIQGPIVSAARHGIWALFHGDDSAKRVGPAGFQEILTKQPSIGVALQRLTPDPDRREVIDRAHFNRHFSFVKAHRLITEGSVSVLFKNLRRVQSGVGSPVESTVAEAGPPTFPSATDTLSYAFSFYRVFVGKLLERFKTPLFGTRYQCWTLFLGEGEFMEATLSELRPVTMPKGEFWADPFILDHEGTRYVFFENYSYTKNRGHISCGVVRDRDLVDIRDVLVVDHHLSFPHVFEEDGDLFMTPETPEKRRLELYRCVRFPDQWELHATAFEGETVGDAFVHVDDAGQKWLFVNKEGPLGTPIENELHLYKVGSLTLDDLVPHPANPVVIDARTARNGGSLFSYKGDLYRPSQANIDSVYGRALNINRINVFTSEEYDETTVATIYPDFHEGLMSTHHLHQADGLFVLDAAFRKR